MNNDFKIGLTPHLLNKVLMFVGLRPQNGKQNDYQLIFIPDLAICDKHIATHHFVYPHRQNRTNWENWCVGVLLLLLYTN